MRPASMFLQVCYKGLCHSAEAVQAGRQAGQDLSSHTGGWRNTTGAGESGAGAGEGRAGMGGMGRLMIGQDQASEGCWLTQPASCA